MTCKDVVCVACDRFSFEKNGTSPTKMATLGAGHCALDKRSYVHTTALFVRDCPNFKPRDVELTNRFIAWLQAQGKK